MVSGRTPYALDACCGMKLTDEAGPGGETTIGGGLGLLEEFRGGKVVPGAASCTTVPALLKNLLTPALMTLLSLAFASLGSWNSQGATSLLGGAWLTIVEGLEGTDAGLAARLTATPSV